MSLLIIPAIKTVTGGGGIPGDHIAHWTMDNISGSTLVDEDGNYDLTINGTVNTESGVIGDALTLDGSTNYANGSITLGNAFTVCGWVNITNLSSNRSIVSIGTGTLPCRIFVTTGGTLFISVNDGAGGFATVSFSGLTGTSAFICGIWRGNGNNMQISVNDGTPSTASQTQNYNNKTNMLLCARRTTDFSDKMLGWIDQFRVYNRALSASEITALYEEV